MESKEAPYLDQYFQLSLKHGTEERDIFQSQFADRAKSMAGSEEERKAKADEIEAARKQRLAALNEELKPIIGKAFDHHDTSRDGVLDVNESKLFFEHFITRYSAHVKGLSAMMAKMFKDNPDMLKMMKEGSDCPNVQEALAAFDETMEGAVAEYQLDEERYNKAAFDAVDANKDGKLMKLEVIYSFLHETADNIKFLEAFPTGPRNFVQKELDKVMAQIIKQG